MSDSEPRSYPGFDGMNSRDATIKEKRMKKVFKISLTVMMVLTFTACGGGDESNSSNNETQSKITFTISGLLESGDIGTSFFVRPNRDYLNDNDQNAIMVSPPEPDGTPTNRGHLVGDDSLTYRQANTYYNSIRFTLPIKEVGTYIFNVNPIEPNENSSMWIRVETRSGNTYKAGENAHPYGNNNRSFSVNITESGDRVKGTFSFFPYVYHIDGSFNQEHSDLVAINGEFDVFYLE
ncbi:MAG: hypothetical protein HQK76_19255 [Desulfobacterales bacterium]|nr:hypothetical protein [Desulfobacterales bacterium]